MTTKKASQIQEKYIAKLLGGKTSKSSGGGKFEGGDVLTKHFLIEAKTTMTPKQSFSIKKEWLEKAKEQSYEQDKDSYALAFQFEPNGDNYFVITEKDMKYLIEMIEEAIG